jgi:hypothetical protein
MGLMLSCLTMHRRTTWITIAGVLAVLGVGTVAGLVIGKRVQTGEWRFPSRRDLVRIGDAVRGTPPGPVVPRVIYLHRGPITLVGGEDDARARVSSVVASAGEHHTHTHGVDEHLGAKPELVAHHEEAPARTVKLRGFRGSAATWKKIRTCVGDLFKPFDVTVTDVEPPPGTPYVMAVVGGRPRDIGHPAKVGGLAPYSGEVIPGAVVFAFADQLGNRARATCEVLGMEVAHSFGLDHEHECKDVMTYLTGCGSKSFKDVDARCGEAKARDCADGAATQNSYRRLMTVLGPRRSPLPAAAPAKR